MTAEAGRPLTLQEVADLLGVHYMTVYRYVRLGLLEAEQGGRDLAGHPGRAG